MSSLVQQQAIAALNDSRPFVLFRKPGDTLVNSWFFKEERPDAEDSHFVFAPFDAGPALFLRKGECEVSKTEWEPVQFNMEDRGLSLDFEAKAAFEALVRQGVSAIRQGAFRKVVLSRCETVSTNLTPVSIFSRLVNLYPSAFVSLWFHPVSGCWIGATPERLLRVEGNSFKTMALAGTQAYEGEESVVWESKEREEQRLVTEYIQEKLEPLSVGVHLSEPFTARAGNLLHLRTDVSGSVAEGCTSAALISALHPTPAVCGLPKQPALDFILENEGYDRAYYAGYLGESGGESGDLFVNLRCMRWSPGLAELFVGCGITADSVPEKEFFETVNKSLTLGRVLS